MVARRVLPSAAALVGQLVSSTDAAARAAAEGANFVLLQVGLQG